MPGSTTIPASSEGSLFTCTIVYPFDITRMSVSLRSTGAALLAPSIAMHGLYIDLDGDGNGGWDLVAEIRCASLIEFDRVLGQIRSVEGVINSESSLLLNSVLRT